MPGGDVADRMASWSRARVVPALFALLSAGCMCDLGQTIADSIVFGLRLTFEEGVFVLVHDGRYVLSRWMPPDDLRAAAATQPSYAYDGKRLAVYRRLLGAQRPEAATQPVRQPEHEWLTDLLELSEALGLTPDGDATHRDRATDFEQRWLVVSRPVREIESQLPKLDWCEGRMCMVVAWRQSDLAAAGKVEAILRKHGLSCMMPAQSVRDRSGQRDVGP